MSEDLEAARRTVAELEELFVERARRIAPSGSGRRSGSKRVASRKARRSREA